MSLSKDDGGVCAIKPANAVSLASARQHPAKPKKENQQYTSNDWLADHQKWMLMMRSKNGKNQRKPVCLLLRGSRCCDRTKARWPIYCYRESPLTRPTRRAPSRTLHRAPVGQGPPGPDWLAISFGFWSGRALATGTAWAGLRLIHHQRRRTPSRSLSPM